MTLALLAMIAAVLLPVLASAESPSAAPMPAPSIYSVEPESAPPGTTLTIIGFGFSTSNIVHFDAQTIADVPVAWSIGVMCAQGAPRCHAGVNQALIITVPEGAKAGRYSLSVETTNGTSNVVPMTVGTP